MDRHPVVLLSRVMIDKEKNFQELR